MKPDGAEHARLHGADDLLLAARTREVVLLRVAQVVARAGEGERLLAVDVRRPAAQAQREAAVVEAAVDARHDAAARVVDAAHRVDECREVVEVDLEDVVDRDAEVLLDRLHRERGAADRVGRVDLVAPVAGDVDDGVARDRELGAVAAAGAHEQDRVAAARARGARSGLLRARRALVGAEDEGRLRLDDPDPAARQLGLRGGGHLVLVDLRRDEEEDQRQADPGHQRERQPFDHPADGDALAPALLRRRAAQLVEHRSVVAATPGKARSRAVELVRRVAPGGPP